MNDVDWWLMIDANADVDADDVSDPDGNANADAEQMSMGIWADEQMNRWADADGIAEVIADADAEKMMR